MDSTRDLLAHAQLRIGQVPGNNETSASTLVANALLPHNNCRATAISGFRTLLVVQGAALLWYVGPRQTVPITCKALVACSLARGLHVLATNSSQVCAQLLIAVLFAHQKMAQHQIACPTQEATDKKDSSIWDWTPPGDLAETGTWKVLRELAGTLSKYTCLLLMQPATICHFHSAMQCYSYTAACAHQLTTHSLTHTQSHSSSGQSDVHPQPF